MDLEKIYIKIKHFQKDSTKNFFNSFKELKPDAIQSALRYEDIGEDIIISFQVDKNDYKYLVEKLEDRGIKIIDLNEKVSLQTKKMEPLTRNSPTVNTQKQPFAFQVKSPGEFKRYDDLVEAGNYRELFKISKNVSMGLSVQQAAKARFRPAVDNAIENAYQKGLKGGFDFLSSLKVLMDIASDKILKANSMIDEMRRAGVCAIDICTYKKDNYDELIKIANNSQLLNIINLKAVVKFSDLVMQDRELYKDEIETAVKKLNTRWLYNAHLSSAKDLTHGELGKYERFINFIIHTRKSEENEEYV